MPSYWTSKKTVCLVSDIAHNYIGDFVINCVDYDGLMLLMDQDFKEFQEWNEDSDKHTLEEAKKGYDKWRIRYGEMLGKYSGLKDPDSTKNISLFTARTSYFYQLSNFVLIALKSYASKLEKELSKSKKTKKKPKVRKRKV